MYDQETIDEIVRIGLDGRHIDPNCPKCSTELVSKTWGEKVYGDENGCGYLDIYAGIRCPKCHFIAYKSFLESADW